MGRIPALFVSRKALKRDPALGPRGRGDRKILVTSVFPDAERQAEATEWDPPAGPEKCPVQLMNDAEVAAFNHTARQDRHLHKLGTEIYIVTEGEMLIEVEGVDYLLGPGDMIVVNPGAAHQVKPGRGEFLCTVVSINCGGAADKYPA
jgi:mannose-6-phosphate isomerase-like protein (cupin superfamily)